MTFWETSFIISIQIHKKGNQGLLSQELEIHTLQQFLA